jgi:hypothetical protein
MSNMAEAAVGKRIKISKIQQQMLLAALGTSLIFGVSLVFSIFFIKYIVFNTKVISEKDTSINNYYTAIKNVGVCKPTANGKYSDKDLENCDPKNIDAVELPGTLRYNVLVDMTNNVNLESVARDTLSKCYDGDGNKYNFVDMYRKAETDKEREKWLGYIKQCSSLRVIPDALPSVHNDAALLSSINKIFLLSNLEPEGLSPSRSSESSPVPGLEILPVSVSVKENAMTTTRLLQNLENSIRSFSFQSAKISWSGEVDGESKLDLSAQAYAFYTNQVNASESTKTIYASKDAKTKGVNSGLKADGGK